jgi:hypothetical protein
MQGTILDPRRPAIESTNPPRERLEPPAKRYEAVNPPPSLKIPCWMSHSSSLSFLFFILFLERAHSVHSSLFFLRSASNTLVHLHDLECRFVADELLNSPLQYSQGLKRLRLLLRNSIARENGLDRDLPALSTTTTQDQYQHRLQSLPQIKIQASSTRCTYSVAEFDEVIWRRDCHHTDH